MIAASKPNVAIISEANCAGPLRTCWEICNSGVSNMKCAVSMPTSAPPNCANAYNMPSRVEITPCIRNDNVTAGLKCAPDTGPKIKISTTSIAPVASVLPSSASAIFPPASRSAMMPDPITAASRNALPVNSAARRRVRSSRDAIGFQAARRSSPWR